MQKEAKGGPLWGLLMQLLAAFSFAVTAVMAKAVMGRLPGAIIMLGVLLIVWQKEGYEAGDAPVNLPTAE